EMPVLTGRRHSQGVQGSGTGLGVPGPYAIIGAPNGRTVLPNVEFTTSANAAYIASRPVTRPIQPPSLRHRDPRPRSPAASRKNVIHRKRKMLQPQRLSRKVAIHSMKVNTPHISSVAPMAWAAGGLIHPAPAVQSRKAYHHQ